MSGVSRSQLLPILYKVYIYMYIYIFLSLIHLRSVPSMFISYNRCPLFSLAVLLYFNVICYKLYADNFFHNSVSKKMTLKL